MKQHALSSPWPAMQQTYGVLLLAKQVDFKVSGITEINPI